MEPHVELEHVEQELEQLLHTERRMSSLKALRFREVINILWFRTESTLGKF